MSPTQITINISISPDGVQVSDGQIATPAVAEAPAPVSAEELAAMAGTPIAETTTLETAPAPMSFEELAAIAGIDEFEAPAPASLEELAMIGGPEDLADDMPPPVSPEELEAMVEEDGEKKPKRARGKKKDAK